MHGGSVELRDGVWHLEGFLNENVPVGSIKAPPGQALILDLGGVEGLNSVALRAFSQMIRAHAGTEVEFHACPQCIVEAINSVPSVAGGADKGKRVKSFFMPAQCKSCRKQGDLLIKSADVRLLKAGVLQLPNLSCPACGGQTAPTVVEEDYLMFLVYAK